MCGFCEYYNRIPVGVIDLKRDIADDRCIVPGEICSNHHSVAFVIDILVGLESQDKIVVANSAHRGDQQEHGKQGAETDRCLCWIGGGVLLPTAPFRAHSIYGSAHGPHPFKRRSFPRF